MVVEQLKNKMTEVDEMKVCIDILNDILITLTRNDVVSEFKLRRSQKRGACFATLLQNESDSDVVRFTNHVQNLSCNKSVFKLREHRLVLDKITRQSRHTRELSHLLLNKFALGR